MNMMIIFEYLIFALGLYSCGNNHDYEFKKGRELLSVVM
jgi:hypothetical protein